MILEAVSAAAGAAPTLRDVISRIQNMRANKNSVHIAYRSSCI